MMGATALYGRRFDFQDGVVYQRADIQRNIRC